MSREELLQAAGLLLLAARALDYPPVTWHDPIHPLRALDTVTSPPYDDPLLLVRSFVAEVLRGALMSDGAGLRVTPVAQDLADILVTAEEDCHLWQPATEGLYSGIGREELAQLLRDSGTSALTEALALQPEGYEAQYSAGRSHRPIAPAPEAHEAKVLDFAAGQSRALARRSAGTASQQGSRKGGI